MSENDPIVGCWQRPGEGRSLVFSGDGAASFELSDEAAAWPVSYVFPRVRWGRSDGAYALHFSRTSLKRAYTTSARIEGQELLIEGQQPLSRADRASCVGLH